MWKWKDVSILSPLLMNTEIQKAYMRGYAKGRAFRKKETFKVRPEYLNTELESIEVPKFIGLDYLFPERSPSKFFQKSLNFFRNGFSL